MVLHLAISLISSSLVHLTLGSRGYFFLIDTDGSRRGRVNEALCVNAASVSIRKKYPLEPRVCTPGRLLRSSNQFLLSTSKFNLKTYGGRSFTIAAPSVWNALPFELRSCNSLLFF